MPAERYYLDAPLENGSVVLLEGPEFHHLAHVMRAKAEDEIEIVNGNGQLAKATIETIDKKKARLHLNTLSAESPTHYQVILAQALPRINRLDFILEKGTELGMTEIWLFPSSHSERKALTEHQIERLTAITIAAMKQCGRLYLPKITLQPPLTDWEKPSLPLFFGDTKPEAPSFQSQWKSTTPGLIFAVGPESGFTSQEIKKLIDMEATGVTLHRSILRTDTASLAALALVNHWLLDL